MVTATESTGHADADDALATGVRSAAAMLADEIEQGSRASAVEVSVEGADGRRLSRVVVSLSVARLVVD